MDRRIFLCQILRIPPALLGLTWRSLLSDDQMPQYLNDTEFTAELLGANSYGLYEDMLTFASTNPHRYSQEAAYRFYKHQQELERIVKTAPVLEKDSWLDLLSRYYQHSMFVAQHHMQGDLAISYADKALSIALSLTPKDAELVGSSHYKRARVYLTQDKHNLAIEEIQAALEKVEHVRSPLRGSTYLLAAEINAVDAPQEGKVRTQCRQWQDGAATLLYKKKKESDGTFIVFNLYAVHHERAKMLTRFALFHTTDNELINSLKDKYTRANATLLKDARSELMVARKHLEAINGTPINDTTVVMDCTLTEARLLLTEREFEESAKVAKVALNIARAANSEKGVSEVGKIHTILSQVAPKDPYVCNLGIRLGRL